MGIGVQDGGDCPRVKRSNGKSWRTVRLLTMIVDAVAHTVLLSSDLRTVEFVYSSASHPRLF